MGLYDDATFVRKARRVLTQADPRMAEIIARVGRFAPGVVPRTFDALVRSIIHQQLSMKAAQTIATRVRKLCPRGRLSAAGLTRQPDEALRAAGLSRQKVGYLRSVCEHFRNGTLDRRRLQRLSDQQVIDELTVIKGVGVWTAEMILMFNLQRPDVWPVDDLGLRQALRRSYRIPGSAGRPRLIRAGERFRPYRSVATWYLWSSLNTGVVPGFD